MQTNSKRDSVEPPHDAEIRAALDRVVSSAHLNKSPQLANFLRFVVEQKLAGQGDRLKAYTIAADALGRDSNFDPQNDPIVRVEAGRLRRALQSYYADGGDNDPIVIDMPRGGYVPVFRAKTVRRRTIVRLHTWRRQIAETVRENLRLMVMIVVIAATVSIAIDLLWMLIFSHIWPAISQAWQTAPSGAAPYLR